MNPQLRKLRKAQANRTISKKACTSKTSCMRNSVILRTICSYFSTSDLLNCRLVSKLWYLEVNSAMHRSKIALKISWERLLDQVAELNVLIPNMSLPFNGVSFWNSRWHKNKEDSENETLHEFLRVMPPMKHLQFSGFSASEELILRVMESNVNNLETLSIYSTGINVPIEILGGIFKLKNLRKILMTTNSRASGDKGNLSSIIAECETLESVEGIIFRDLTGVPESRWHVIKNFHLFIGVRPYDWGPLEKYLHVVPEGRRFTALTIDSRYSSHSEEQMPVNIVNSCKETLTSLRLDLGTLKLPSIYDLCGEALQLRSLVIDGHVQSIDDLESELVGTFPDEVVFLRAMKLTKLRKLQIVPVRPALHFLTGLVQLTIDVYLEPNHISNLLHWNNKTDGIDYLRRRNVCKVVKALSLERMRSLWI